MAFEILRRSNWACGRNNNKERRERFRQLSLRVFRIAALPSRPAPQGPLGRCGKVQEERVRRVTAVPSDSIPPACCRQPVNGHVVRLILE